MYSGIECLNDLYNSPVRQLRHLVFKAVPMLQFITKYVKAVSVKSVSQFKRVLSVRLVY